MEDYEITPLMNYLHQKNKESWEQTRLLGYIVAQGNSTKKLSPSDIIKFPWDNKEEMLTGITTISNEDIQRLKNKSKQYINNG